LYKNVQFSLDLFYHAIDAFMSQGGKSKYDEMIDPRFLQFVKDKFESIEMSLHLMNWQRTSTDISPKQAFARELALEMNILEAGHTDAEHGFEDNAAVSIMLAHWAKGRGPLSRLDATRSNNRYLWPLGKSWVDLYIAWNAAFVTQLSEADAVPALTILALPSTLCTSEEYQTSGQEFLVPRAVSLFLHLISVGDPNRPDQGGLVNNPKLGKAFGKSNVEQSWGVRAPSEAEMEDLLYQFPYPSSSLYIYYAPLLCVTLWEAAVTFSLWGSVMVVGWGSEFIMFRYFIGRAVVSDSAQGAWVYGQLMFL
jgi:hypothetical protein